VGILGIICVVFARQGHPAAPLLYLTIILGKSRRYLARLRLLSDLDRFACVEDVSPCCFRFCPDEEDDRFSPPVSCAQGSLVNEVHAKEVTMFEHMTPPSLPPYPTSTLGCFRAGRSTRFSFHARSRDVRIFTRLTRISSYVKPFEEMLVFLPSGKSSFPP